MNAKIRKFADGWVVTPDGGLPQDAEFFSLESEAQEAAARMDAQVPDEGWACTDFEVEGK